MKKFLTILTLFLMMAPLAIAKEKEGLIPSYTILGSGAQGTGKVIEVTILTKKQDKVDFDMLKKAAVHGLLFRGYANNNGQLGGATNTPPVMGSPTAEEQHAEFFTPFFQDGRYASYVQHIDGSRRVIKSGKEYKVSCKVIVQEGTLRQDLMNAGVLKGLRGGW